MQVSKQTKRFWGMMIALSGVIMAIGVGAEIDVSMYIHALVLGLLSGTVLIDTIKEGNFNFRKPTDAVMVLIGASGLVLIAVLLTGTAIPESMKGLVIAIYFALAGATAYEIYK